MFGTRGSPPIRSRIVFMNAAANCEIRTFSSFENCCRMQELVWVVEHFS